MRKLTLVLGLLLAGCVRVEPHLVDNVEPCCSRGFLLNLISEDGKEVANCHHSCYGRQVSPKCTCQKDCVCQR